MADKTIIEAEVKSNIGTVADDLERAADNTKDLKDGTDKASKGFKGLGTAVKGVGMAMKAAGIGLIIAAFAALKEALGRNQTVMDKVSTIMTTISTTFNDVVQVLTDVVVWVTASAERFNGLSKVIGGLLTLALTPLKLSFYAIKLGVEQAMLAWEDSFLGGGDEDKLAELRGSIKDTKNDIVATGKAAIDAGYDIYNNFSDAVSEIGDIYAKTAEGITQISIKANHEQAKATTAAANSSKLASAELQGLIEKYDRQAELQRQIRDDETKTFAERIAANEELGRILEEQEEKMLSLADTKIASAKLELDANKDNIDLQVAYKEALNDRAAVEAQVAGFRSEQLTNQVSLEKELLEAQRELAQEGLSGIEKELLELKNAYELKKEMARKAGEDDIAITEQYEEQKAEIIKKGAEELEDFKKDLQMKAFRALGANLDASMSELEGNYSREKRLAQERHDAILERETELGRDTTELAKKQKKELEKIDKKHEAERQKIAKQQKAFKVAEALITTYQMASLAYKDGLEAGGPAGLVLGPIAAGVAVLAGLANVRTILAQDVGGGGGGGGSVSAADQPPAPQMMSGAFDISGGVAPEASKAYVVTDEMSNSQNQLANIRRRATI